MEDLLIRGGQVIDGNGTPARRADVAIRNGHITAVGECEGREAQRVIDASGQIVAPGFIDIHTHSDFTLPLNPLAVSKIRQGVTTEVVGNCGYSTAPVLPGKAEALQDYLRAGPPWLEYEPRTFAQYMEGFPSTSVNTVTQVGHANPAPDGHGPGGARPHCQRTVSYAATPVRGPGGRAPWACPPGCSLRRGTMPRARSCWPWQVSYASTVPPMPRTSAMRPTMCSRQCARPSTSARVPECGCRSPT